jgi:hypothetical protein
MAVKLGVILTRLPHGLEMEIFQLSDKVHFEQS